jgi:hypothetical protein
VSVPVDRVILRVSADAQVECPFSKRAERLGTAGYIGEEIRMRSMKMGMAAAAACVAMLSMTMIAKRKRGARKGRKR